MTTDEKTFSIEYDGRSSDLPIIKVKHHGLTFDIYFFTDYEDIADLDLTADKVTYTYHAPSGDDCSILWDRHSCSFVFSYHEDASGQVYGGGTSLDIPLTPKTHKELCDVFEELKKYSFPSD
jgi:hypothetical protein